MSLITSQTLSDVDPCFMRATSRCFHCGEPLTSGVWIMWNGNDEKGQQIWMHPECARDLATHLHGDYMKALFHKLRQAAE